MEARWASIEKRGLLSDYLIVCSMKLIVRLS